MGSVKCTLRKEVKNEIAKYIDNEFINETIKEIVNYIKTTHKVQVDDSEFDKYDINSKVNLKDNGSFNVYDYMYELEGSEIRMFGYMYFMQIEDDNCIRIDLEDDDCNLSCFIDLNDNYMDKAGNLISAEELQVILKSFKNSGIMFVSGTVEVKNDDPVILVDSMENCMFGIKKLKS